MEGHRRAALGLVQREFVGDVVRRRACVLVVGLVRLVTLGVAHRPHQARGAQRRRTRRRRAHGGRRPAEKADRPARRGLVVHQPVAFRIVWREVVRREVVLLVVRLVVPRFDALFGRFLVEIAIEDGHVAAFRRGDDRGVVGHVHRDVGVLQGTVRAGIVRRAAAGRVVGHEHGAAALHPVAAGLLVGHGAPLVARGGPLVGRGRARFVRRFGGVMVLVRGGGGRALAPFSPRLVEPAAARGRLALRPGRGLRTVPLRFTPHVPVGVAGLLHGVVERHSRSGRGADGGRGRADGHLAGRNARVVAFRRGRVFHAFRLLA